jgi:ribosomal protein S27AE
MHTESIKCPGCGSAVVTEFKQDSFVCGHCKAVFKYVDPAKLAVPGRDFCQCGNPVEALCGTCESGVCGVGDRPRGVRRRGGCESRVLDRRVGEGWDPYPPTRDNWFTLVAVPSGGYRFLLGQPVQESASGEHFSGFVMTSKVGAINCRDKAVAEGALRPIRVEESGWVDHYLSSAQVWGYLSAAGDADMDRYMCLRCFGEAGRMVSKALSANSICADPFCGLRASQECPCCQKPNCGKCLFKGLLDCGTGTSLGREILIDNAVGATADAPAVCMACYGEYALTEDDLKPIELRNASTSTGRRRNWRRAKAAAEARASTVSLRWKRQLNGGCRGVNGQPFPIVRC